MEPKRIELFTGTLPVFFATLEHVTPFAIVTPQATSIPLATAGRRGNATFSADASLLAGATGIEPAVD